MTLIKQKMMRVKNSGASIMLQFWRLDNGKKMAWDGTNWYDPNCFTDL